MWNAQSPAQLDLLLDRLRDPADMPQEIQPYPHVPPSSPVSVFEITTCMYDPLVPPGRHVDKGIHQALKNPHHVLTQEVEEKAAS